MEDIDGGLHPAVDGQSLDEGEDERITPTWTKNVEKTSYHDPEVTVQNELMTTLARAQAQCWYQLTWCQCNLFFFFFLAFAVYTIKAAREMNDVVFSSSCLQP